MFARASSFLIALLFATLAAATYTVTVTTHTSTPTATPASQCNTGGLYCCNDVEQASTNLIAGLLSIISVVVSPITALVGSTCSPINVAGILGTGSACTAQPVCCENNQFAGFIVIGCTPVNVGV